MSALVDAARTAANRSPAYTATGGRVGSTFTRGSIPGGAVWFWQEPGADGLPSETGRVWMLRISPRRVLLDLQTAAGVATDAKYGPETRAGFIRMTGEPADATDETLYLAALAHVYHRDRGQLYVPHATEFPTAATIREIVGDDSYTDAVELSTGREVQGAAAVRGLADAATTAPAPALRPVQTADPAPAPAAQESPGAALARTRTPAELAALYDRGGIRWEDIPPAVQLQITNLRAAAARVATAPAGFMGWVQAHPVLTLVGATGAIAGGYALVKEATKKPRREAA